MGEKLNEHAQAFRSLPREEDIARLKADSDKMLAIFGSLTAEEWGGFNVTHPYMGPLPTLFYPAFHVMDYGVHTWDMKWGLGQKDAKLDERTAGVLVPYMFILMQVTVDQESARGVDAVFGVKVDGEWGGQWRVTVKDGTYSYEPADNLDWRAGPFSLQRCILILCSPLSNGFLVGRQAATQRLLIKFGTCSSESR